MTATKPALDWEFYATLGSWTAHLPDGSRYLIQSDHIMDWKLHQRIRDRYYARLVIPRAPQEEIGYFDTVNEAKRGCAEHWQAQ